MFGLAVVTSAVALALFPREQERYGWPLHAAGLVLSLVALYVLVPPPNAAAKLPGPPRSVIGAAALIAAVAATLRYYRLEALPFGTWWDEASYGLLARRILGDPGFRPVFLPGYDHPLHFFYVVALWFEGFGDTTESLRLATATFGVVTVVVAFLLGREIYGERFGLLLAFLFAVSRWHLTFSRFAIPTITLAFFSVLTLWLLFRAMRTRRPHDFAWAGLALGVGLNFQIAFRLFPLLAAAILACWTAAEWRAQPTRRRGLALALSCFAIAALLAVAPVAEYAILHSDVFWGRAADVSIFHQRDEPDLGRALWSNTVKHLLMFNLEGDRNGRHNLPGAPMLDAGTGVLFVLGLGLAASRWRQLPNLAFLILFALGLSPGVLTLDFEAPQGSRAFGALPAVLYFAALAAETLWRGVERLPLGRHAGWGVGLVAAGLSGGSMLALNAHTYFVSQARDGAVWEAHNGVETLTARQMLALDPARTTFYASVFLNNHLVIQFLAPEVRDSRTIIPPIGLPLHEPGDRPVALFVDRENTWILDEIARYYPGAKLRTFANPSGTPALHVAVVSAEGIKSLQGLTASYWEGPFPRGRPALVRAERSLAADWSSSRPLAPPFVAEWSGTLYAPTYGDYELVLESPATAALWLDGRLISSGSGERRVSARLAIGEHALRVQAAGGRGRLALRWRPPDRPEAGQTFALEDVAPRWLSRTPPVANNGLLGSYHAGADGSGPPAFQRVDPFLDMYIHIIPLPRPYTVDWVGRIEAPSGGEYSFGLRVHGRAKLHIDERLVVDAPSPTEYVEGRVILTPGRHKLHLRFLDDRGSSRLHLYWRPPGAAERQIVPASALWPYP